MSEPEQVGQPVPINAHFEGGLVTQLVLVLDTDTVADVADKVAYHAVGRWVTPRDAAMVVSVNGRALPSDATVTEAGITPMQAVTVGWAR